MLWESVSPVGCTSECVVRVIATQPSVSVTSLGHLLCINSSEKYNPDDGLAVTVSSGCALLCQCLQGGAGSNSVSGGMCWP